MFLELFTTVGRTDKEILLKGVRFGDQI